MKIENITSEDIFKDAVISFITEDKEIVHYERKYIKEHQSDRIIILCYDANYPEEMWHVGYATSVCNV